MKELNYKEGYYFVTDDFDQEMLDKLEPYADGGSLSIKANWLCFCAASGGFYSTNSDCLLKEVKLTKEGFNNAVDDMLPNETLEEEYTLEARDNGMLPPIGSKATFCVCELAFVDETIKALNDVEVLIIAHNERKTIATCVILDEFGDVMFSQTANNMWFKPIEDEKVMTTMETLEMRTNSILTPFAMACYILDDIKNGDVPNVYYKEEG